MDPVLNDQFRNAFEQVTTDNFFKGFKVRTGKTYSSIFFSWLQVLVHYPYEFPEVTKKSVAVGTGQEVFIGVSADYIES